MTAAGPIGVTVCGALGRMGRSVARMVLAQPELRLTGLVEKPDCPFLGRSLDEALGGGQGGPKLTADFAAGAAEADVYIDFTAAPASLAYLEQAARRKLPAVIGTTGFTPADQARLQEAGRSIPVLWAPNMSLGISALTRAAADLARSLGPAYDVEIVELHHRQKQDAPSGTALKLLRAAAQAKGLNPDEALVTERRGLTGPRTDGEIGVLAGRGGDVVGDHTVYFFGPGERLELTHRAHSRDLFARGAVRAAAWLASGRPPGLYTLEDVLET